MSLNDFEFLRYIFPKSQDIAQYRWSRGFCELVEHHVMTVGRTQNVSCLALVYIM